MRNNNIFKKQETNHNGKINTFKREEANVQSNPFKKEEISHLPNPKIDTIFKKGGSNPNHTPNPFLNNTPNQTPNINSKNAPLST